MNLNKLVLVYLILKMDVLGGFTGLFINNGFIYIMELLVYLVLRMDIYKKIIGLLIAIGNIYTYIYI